MLLNASNFKAEEVSTEMSVLPAMQEVECYDTILRLERTLTAEIDRLLVVLGTTSAVDSGNIPSSLLTKLKSSRRSWW